MNNVNVNETVVNNNKGENKMSLIERIQEARRRNNEARERMKASLKGVGRVQEELELRRTQVEEFIANTEEDTKALVESALVNEAFIKERREEIQAIDNAFNAITVVEDEDLDELMDNPSSVVEEVDDELKSIDSDPQKAPLLTKDKIEAINDLERQFNMGPTGEDKLEFIEYFGKTEYFKGNGVKMKSGDYESLIKTINSKEKGTEGKLEQLCNLRDIHYLMFDENCLADLNRQISDLDSMPF